jgi:hypothetical protein
MRNRAQIESGFDWSHGEQPMAIEEIGSGGGRYELYSNYPLKIQAVAASVVPA